MIAPPAARLAGLACFLSLALGPGGAFAQPRLAAPFADPLFVWDQPVLEPGTRRLLSSDDHVGVSLGPAVVGSSVYAGVIPGVAFYLPNGVSFWLQAPLRLQAFDANTQRRGSLRIRRQDWDEPADFAKVVRLLAFEGAGGRLRVRVSPLHPATLGYGLLMNRYQGDIDIDRSRTGLRIDAAFRAVGGQLTVSDVTLGDRLVGGLLYVRPFDRRGFHRAARGVAVGVEYAGDFRAPRCIRRNDGTDQAAGCVQGTGNQLGRSASGEPLDKTFVRTDPNTGRFVTTSALAHAVGVPVEVALTRSAPDQLTIFGGWYRFLNAGGGHGAAVGAVGRRRLSSVGTQVLRWRTEYRLFQDGFSPGYFDTLYDVHKYGVVHDQQAQQVAPTKYQLVFGDLENGFVRPAAGPYHGFNVEASWGLSRRDRGVDRLLFAVGLQDSTAPRDTGFYAHMEARFAGRVQIFVTYLGSRLGGPADVFRQRGLDAQNKVLLSGLRLELLPVLFVNARYSQSFRVVRSPGAEYHLGNASISDPTGRFTSTLGQDQLFQNERTLFVELEFGWEFDRARRDDEDDHAA